MNICCVCKSDNVQRGLSLGRQPVASHFLPSQEEDAPGHELALGVCQTCGVIQIMSPFPVKDLIPPYEWITYREPEDHLDAVVDTLLEYATYDSDKTVLGLSFKDQTTLDRLHKKGFQKTHCLDPVSDLGAKHNNAGFETVHESLNAQTAQGIIAKHGTSSLVIARHIVEHTADVYSFMSGIYEMLTPCGCAVIEVPDCKANLQRFDYAMIWEEHVSYFTPETVQQIAHAVNLKVLRQDIFHHAFEDVIVLYLQKPEANAKHNTPKTALMSQEVIAESNTLFQDFCGQFSSWTETYHRICQNLTADGRKLAAYGAGHLTCAVLNFHDLGSYFAAIIDDTPQKQGLYLPGTRTPIVPRENLNAQDISACFFGLAPEIEDKIIAKNAKFVEDGGQFFSLLVDSQRTLRNLA